MEAAMNKFLFKILSVCALLGMAGCSSKGNEKPKAEQNSFWIGVFDLGALKLNLSFDVAKGPDGATYAYFGCLEQGIFDLPIEVQEQKDGLRFDLKKLGASYEGKFNADRTELHGTFTQNGASFPLNLKKTQKQQVSVPVRPQEPKLPYPYDAEDVTYRNDKAGVTLAGTLTLPRIGRPCPAVLLIAGSGPNDRDESVFGHKPFLVLADHLTRQGIAVLRVDKRGVGKSTGTYDASTGEDFAEDVLAGIVYLKSRSEIDAKKIGLIGHSEGGTLAPLAASQCKDVQYIVMMAGTGVNGEEILYEQGALVARAMGLKEEQVQRQLAMQKEMFAVLRNAVDSKSAEEQLRQIVMKDLSSLSDEEREGAADAMEAQVQRCNSKAFRYFLTYEPKEALKKVLVPTLVLNGALDLQVSPKQNLPVIEQALKDAGNKDFRIVEFPNINHLFQTCETGSILEYAKIEETIAPIVLQTISDWILEKTGGKNAL